MPRHTGFASLPLHGGKAPAWLFQRMVRLSREIVQFMAAGQGAHELVYGRPASTRHPARFAFAHGGKDGTPFPVDRDAYERTIQVFANALNRAAVDRAEKVKAFKRLAAFAGDPQAAADSSRGGR